jgi:hypothetical protein
MIVARSASRTNYRNFEQIGVGPRCKGEGMVRCGSQGAPMDSHFIKKLIEPVTRDWLAAEHGCPFTEREMPLRWNGLGEGKCNRGKFPGKGGSQGLETVIQAGDGKWHP